MKVYDIFIRIKILNSVFYPCMLGYDNISINLLAPAVWEPILYQLEDPHQANY